MCQNLNRISFKTTKVSISSPYRILERLIHQEALITSFKLKGWSNARVIMEEEMPTLLNITGYSSTKIINMDKFSSIKY